VRLSRCGSVVDRGARHRLPSDPDLDAQSAADALAHRLFLLTLGVKGVLDAMQLAIAGAILSGFSREVPRIAHWMVAAELAEDPSDPFARRIVSLADSLPRADLTFYAAYFGLHGLLHAGVVAALIVGALWAYPATILVLLAFILYQAIEWFVAGGAMLLVLLVIDGVVIWLTTREWEAHRRRAS